MKRYNFVETGMGYKRLEEHPQGEFVRYEDAARLATISPTAWALREAIERFEEKKKAGDSPDEKSYVFP